MLVQRQVGRFRWRGQQLSQVRDNCGNPRIKRQKPHSFWFTSIRDDETAYRTIAFVLPHYVSEESECKFLFDGNTIRAQHQMRLVTGVGST